jgi:hypothetical protein
LLSLAPEKNEEEAKRRFYSPQKGKKTPLSLLLLEKNLFTFWEQKTVIGSELLFFLLLFPPAEPTAWWWWG